MRWRKCTHPGSVSQKSPLPLPGENSLEKKTNLPVLALPLLDVDFPPNTLPPLILLWGMDISVSHWVDESTLAAVQGTVSAMLGASRDGDGWEKDMRMMESVWAERDG